MSQQYSNRENRTIRRMKQHNAEHTTHGHKQSLRRSKQNHTLGHSLQSKHTRTDNTTHKKRTQQGNTTRKIQHAACGGINNNNIGPPKDQQQAR